MQLYLATSTYWWMYCNEGVKVQVFTGNNKYYTGSNVEFVTSGILKERRNNYTEGN